MEAAQTCRPCHKVFGPLVARLAGSHSSIVRCVEFLDFDRFVCISGGENGRICLWELD